MLRLLRSAEKIHLSRLGLVQHPQVCNFHSSVNRRLNNLHGKNTAPIDLSNFKKSEIIHGFIVDEITEISELYITAVRLTHLSTGAQYLHLARDDSNNVFSIGFRTTPTDSTGLPHILEHTTLCGSEKYPCRDPFFKMLRRSLATFMNAMTGPDYTIYPFSTQNLKDFRNLQSVYLDSVFNPNLRELDFKQEGWRLEHADVNDKNSPIVFKGVVFNEMKGVFNSNQAILAEHLLNSLLPSHTYSVISGGDPLCIPNLKHFDLLIFHETYYHPSNSRLYSYGNFPLEDHLKFVDDHYLYRKDRMDVSKTKVPSEKRWLKAKKKHITCRPDPMIADPSRSGTIAIGTLCNDIIHTQTSVELSILSQLLLREPQSEFYKALIESKIATGFGPVTGYDTHCKDTMFVLSLQGVKPEDFERVEEIYNKTLKKVYEEGFEKDRIEAILHGIELQVKHQTSNFGLNLLFNITPLWNHDGNVIDSLKINQAVHRLRNHMESDPNRFQNLLKKFLINNKHKLTLTMLPDDKYEQNLEEAERKLLENKLKKLSKEDLDKIYTNGKMLLEEQQKKEDINVLPTLKIEDLKDDVDRYKFTDVTMSNVPLQVAVEPTNGMTYYQGILNTRDLPVELKESLPLFNAVVARMGTEKYNYRDFDQLIQLKTGGLSFGIHVIEQKSNILQHEEGISMYSYCLDRNVNDMFELWIELFNHVKLEDLQIFDTLVKTIASNLVNGISHAGHLYAMSTAAGLVSPIHKLKDNFSGLTNVNRMKKIAQQKDLTPVLEQIREIAHRVLNKKHLRSAVNLCEESKDNVLKNIDEFYQKLKDTPEETYLITTNQEIITNENSIHHVLPYTVNYASKAISTVPFIHEDYAPLRILAKLITSIYLHPEIREKGGAYGGGARLSDGVFLFYSYRDPNSTRTFDIFENTCDFLLNYDLSQNDILEAKLGVFQDIDSPIPPSRRGMLKFLHNISDDEMQRYREQLKAVTKEQLIHVAEKYLKPDQKDVKIGRSLLGPANSDLLARHTENWNVLDQEEKTQARAAE